MHFHFNCPFPLISCRLGDSSLSKVDQKRDSLLGLWTNDTSGTVTMEIRRTDNYYPFMPGSFPYKIIGDTIELTRVDGALIGPVTWSAKATFENDSLFLHEQEKLVKYWRVNSKDSNVKVKR